MRPATRMRLTSPTIAFALGLTSACLLCVAACGRGATVPGRAVGSSAEGSVGAAEEAGPSAEAPEELSATVTLDIRLFDDADEADASDAAVRIVVPDYNEDWSAVPVRFSSFADPNQDVDELCYLRRDGDGSFVGTVELPRSRYTIAVAAPVVSPDGELYVMDEVQYEGGALLGLADLRRYTGTGKDQPSVARIELYPLMPALISDEMVERTLAYAEDEGDGAHLAHVSESLELVEAHRQEAQSRSLTERERLALGYVTAYCDVDTPDGLDEYGFTHLASRDRDEWLADCMSYLDPSTPLYEYFPLDVVQASEVLHDNPDAGPFMGIWDAWSVLESATVLSSEGDEVTVAIAGWSGNGELIDNFHELRPIGLGATIVTFNANDKIADVRIESLPA